MLLKKEDLLRMQNVDVRDVDREGLTDIKDISIDTTKPVAVRMNQFASQTNNLFISRVGDYIVKVSYSDTTATINDRVNSYLEKMSKIAY